MKIFKMSAAGFLVVSVICLILGSCSGDPGEAAVKLPKKAPIYPEYQDITIPVNIAPLNFRVRGANKIKAVFSIAGDDVLTVSSAKGGLVRIPEKKWRSMLEEASGKDIKVTVSIWNKENKDGVEYKPFVIHVSADRIDPYLSYRLIEPGYEGWKRMGIYQRNLENFSEKRIVDNYINNGGCVNCHSFQKYSPDTMMFHARGSGGGTVIKQGDSIRKVDIKSLGPGKHGTYPSWHPAGRYIAFSSNNTHQTFYGLNGRPIEVYDTGSDFILLDTEKNTVTTDERFIGDSQWESFPSWSPDGKWLYMAVGKPVVMPRQREKLFYDIIRVGFDHASGKFTEQVDTLWRHDAAAGKGSASFPKVSPDGKFLMFTVQPYGTFPVMHDDSDYRMIRLSDGTEIDVDRLNSDHAESYFSWSSSGRWLILSSRRLDGRYSRLFISHVDENGNVGIPFLLPQEDPERNFLRMKSYNLPELMKGEVNISQKDLKRIFKSEK